MKAKAFKIVNLILAVLVFVFALSYAFAWFAEDIRKSEDKFDGSSSSPYFAGGTGTYSDPFTLTNQYHLYNLAWLQDTGKFGDNTYYFKLDSDIEIDDGFWLPPIGTDANPFKGYFDGNNKSISNLQITTNSSKLTGVVSGTSVKFSNAVGMFGMTAEDTIKTAKIYNFNLIKPIVEVATSNAVYDSESSAKTNVGIAIGFAKCGVENIGVLEGTLAVKKTGYTSKNSLVGNYDGSLVNGDLIDSDVGSDGDTGQFVPQVFTDNASNLGSIMSGSSFTGSTWVLPYNGTVSSGFSGVGLGAFSLIAGNTTEIRDSSASSFTYYTTKASGTIPTYNSTGGTLSVSLATTNSNTEEADVIRQKVLNGSTQLTSLSKMLYINNSPTESSSGLKAVYETNTVYSASHSSTVYTNCIKVRVKKSTTKIFVIASSGGNETRYLGVYKVSERTDDFNERVNDSTYNEKTELGFVRANPLMQLELPSGGTIVACEFDLSGENAGAGTYQINSTKSGINIYYVSVTGTTDGDSGSTVTDPKLKNIDFIYRSSDSTESSDNVVLIDSASSTNVIVKFTTTQITYLYFYRPTGGKDSNNYTLDVEYNGTAPTAKSTGAGGNCRIISNAELTVD